MIKSGQIDQLHASVRRITAPNPSVLTGAGTNTYLLGTERIAVLDPGPDDEVHIQRILSACNGQSIDWILVTHTHHDHSPAAAKLQALTGAQLIGPNLADDGYQDVSFVPQRLVSDGDVLDLAGLQLQAIHTPGHVSNHFCYHLLSANFLFSGDHIMQGSTVVIIPPAGVMKDYMASLRKLQGLEIVAIAPGHGELITAAQAEIAGLIEHRLFREDKTLLALRRLMRSSIDELTPVVYDDVDVSLHAVAQLSLLAHLIKLQSEGRVRLENEIWLAVNS